MDADASRSMFGTANPRPPPMRLKEIPAKKRGTGSDHTCPKRSPITVPSNIFTERKALPPLHLLRQKVRMSSWTCLHPGPLLLRLHGPNQGSSTGILLRRKCLFEMSARPYEIQHSRKGMMASVRPSLNADSYDSDLPVIVSLEVHAGAEQQEIMVEIMKSVWKGFLVPLPVSDCTTLPSPDSLRCKILVKVKYSNPKKAAAKLRPGKDALSSDLRSKSRGGSSSSASENEELYATHDPEKKKKKSSIVSSLSALGIYTRAYHFKSLTAPEAMLPTHVFSLSEKKLMEVHASSGPTLFSHNRNYLMRAFPSGMRVRSDNLDPSVFWRKGVQMVALNWQRWDEGMMLNEAMFRGSSGYILKPNGYLGNQTSSAIPRLSTESQADAIAHKLLTLSIEVFAAQSIPLPLGDTRPSGFHPYVKCELHVEKPAERTGEPIEGGGKAKEGEYKWSSRTMKGTEVDFGAEKVEFKEIPGVVEELSFLRYLRFSSLRTSCFPWSCWSIELGIDNQREAGVTRFRCEEVKKAR